MIRYRAGYRFQLAETYQHATGLVLDDPVETAYLTLSADGLLTIAAGYAWDGPSGPVQPTADFMRSSLVHDALYQLMREGLLAPGHRYAADLLLRNISLEDGMPPAYADMVYRAVCIHGGRYVEPGDLHPVLVAPAPVVYVTSGALEAP